MIARIAVAAVTMAALSTFALAKDQPVVAAQDGNIVVKAKGHVTQITSSSRDSDPVLSPDGTIVVFSRGSRADADAGDGCKAEAAQGAGIWSVRVDGSSERKLVAARATTDPKTSLCAFRDKQFSRDGTRLYFESSAWATSGALHAYDFRTKAVRFVAASNGFHVIARCDMPDYQGALLVNQHRYFVAGGSFDWYWLLTADGKQLGPVGEATAVFEEACGIKLGR
jgi:hypothetical protein